MPLLKRKSILAASVETTPGTSPTLVAGDCAFNAYDVVLQPSIDMQTREGQGAFGYLPSVPGMYKGTCTFKTDLGWDGTTTIPTWASVLLAGCGVVNAAGTLTPRSEAPGSNVKTLTLAHYVDGVRRQLVGAVGNVVFNLPTGRMAFAEWSFEGVFFSEIDTVFLSSIVYPTALPLRFASATACSFNSIPMRVEQITINLGNVIHLREDPTTAAGLLAGIIVDRNPKLTANPEKNLVSVQDRQAIWQAMTEAAIQITMDAPGAGTLAFSAPKAQIINNQIGDRDKLATDELEFQFGKNGSTADQELSIIFTGV